LGNTFKVSDRILAAISDVEQKRPALAAIIFDCDGVLIDSSRSYDLSLELCARAFASVLGFQIPSSSDRLYKAVESLRRLGTFNNDWDTLAVITAFMYSKSKSRDALDAVGMLDSSRNRLRTFETLALRMMEGGGTETLDLSELDSILGSMQTGALRDEIISRLIPDAKLRAGFYRCVSYPKPVGESLLGTFFDEIMYGGSVFRETYGFECATSRMSNPGLISNERVLVEASTLGKLSELCSGTFGIITGRPKVPTIFSLGNLYSSCFTDQSICKFTGDYLLNSDEVKPSPRPMLQISSALKEKSAPILYVGDSGEDLLLTKRFNALDEQHRSHRVLFAAVASSPEKAEFFQKEGDVDCIVSSVNELPAVFSKNVEQPTPA